MQKKLLSLTLAVLVCLSLLPAPALAADSTPMDISQLIIKDDLPYDSAAAYNSYVKVSQNTDGKSYNNRYGLAEGRRALLSRGSCHCSISEERCRWVEVRRGRRAEPHSDADLRQEYLSTKM